MSNKELGFPRGKWKEIFHENPSIPVDNAAIVVGAIPLIFDNIKIDTLIIRVAHFILCLQRTSFFFTWKNVFHQNTGISMEDRTTVAPMIMWKLTP